MRQPKRVPVRLAAAISTTGLLICLVLFNPDQTEAQARVDNGRNFGIGVMFGEPTGISIKSWSDDQTAYDIGAAWSLSGRNEAVHLHANYLWHAWFGGIERGRLAFYFGIGGRIIFADTGTVGIRIPLGLNYVFERAPFDLFTEAVPILNLTPDTEFAGNGAVGIRFYF